MDKKIIGIVGILGAGFYLMKDKISDSVSDVVSETVAKNLKLQGLSIANFDFGWTGFSFDLRFDLVNLSSISIPVDGLIGYIFFGENKVFNLRVSNSITLAANSEKKVSFDVDIEYLDLGFDIYEIVSTGAWRDAASFKGQLSSGGFTLPFDYPIYDL